jgi:helicase, recD/traA family
MTEVYFKGIVEKIIFHNPDSMYYIASIKIKETDSDYTGDTIVVTGNMVDLQEDNSYVFKGEIVQNGKRGEQLKVSFYELDKLEGENLISYFASDQFKGIGPKKAMKIIEIYGDDPIDKILEDPSKLATISGLTQRVREAFVQTLKGDYQNQQTIAKIVSYGLTLPMATKLIKKYEDDTLNVINENPYLMTRSVKGFSFANADLLAKAIGIKGDSPFRIEAAFRQVLASYSGETGDTYMLAGKLIPETYQLLVNSRPEEGQLITDELLKNLLNEFIEDRRFYCDFDNADNNKNKIFLYSSYMNEFKIVENVIRIMDSEGYISSNADIDSIIDEVEEEVGFSYDAIQRKAIKEAVISKFFVLTGGPGTGKTTVINGILKTYEKIRRVKLRNEKDIVKLLAPTGKAARRMGEATGLSASTIHSALGLTKDDEDSSIEQDYLECDFVIIDEFSMVDAWLGKQLFTNLSSRTQVLIVGDKDQLPSVGAGRVLGDFLEIDEVPSIRLQTTFRQGSDSSIISLATALNDGRLPNDFKLKKNDYSYIEGDARKIAAVIPQIFQVAMDKGFSSSDIQILAPMYRGEEGIDNLNQIMQNYLNPRKSHTLEFRYLENSCFRIGDKVLHLVNDINKGVSNGDVGYIRDLIPAKDSESKQDEIVIDFGGVDVSYARSDWDRITLAYAISIHKSQGSEFPVVIMPITNQAYKMLQRNLVYTGVTRAKQKLILLGSENAYLKAVRTEGSKRNTFLKELFAREYNL